ncbi:YibE/F family protein [Protofrankia coriariae]|uniref:YibE/F family protein n=1 Tax=Protofrankia coriariae TaxID=1562887 RepID=A0ABR5EYW5_9ACTN|nr:YibE/F family protein [Protofrankia coriariae]KLL09627.1 YibE/F family protein [Protofrankia coriariae]
MSATVALFLILTVAGVVLLWPSGGARETPEDLRGLVGGASQLVDATVERAGRGPCPDLTGAGASQGTCDQIDVVLDDASGSSARLHLDTLVDPTGPILKAGDKVRLAPTTNIAGQATYYVADFQRSAPIGWIAFLTAAMVVAVARWRGLAALVGLVLSYLVIVKFTLPSLLDGHSPVAVAMTTGTALVVVLLYLAHGVSARTTAALLGTVASMALAGAFGALAIDLARITGLGSDEDVMLKAFAGQLSLPGLVLASVIIGSLGLINDMTITQAAAVWEVSDAAPHASLRHLHGSGMRVGRDHIASSVYTLVLAYAGAALPTLLLFTLADRSSTDLAATDLVGAEIVRTAAGTVGLVASVPLTTVIAALAASRRHPPSPELPLTDTDTADVAPGGHGGADTQPLTYRRS